MEVGLLPYADMDASKHEPRAYQPAALFYRCTLCILRGGDRCQVGNYVVVREGAERYVGKVMEIAQQQRYSGSPDPTYILVKRFTLDDASPNVYQMPYLVPTDQVTITNPEVCHPFALPVE